MPHLPEEILLKIFSCLQLCKDVEESLWGCHPSMYRFQRFDHKTMASLCRASRYFQSLAEPILYRVLLIYTDTQAVLLSRTFRKRPDLARKVHHLDMDGYCENELAVQEAFQTVRELLDIPSDVKDLIAESLESEDQSHGGHVAFFLSMMPNLEVLHVTIPCDHEVLVKYFQAISSGTEGMRLPKLREIGLRHWDTEYALDMSAMDDLLVLPSLETFCGSAVDWCDAHTATTPLAFKHIALENSLIDSQGLSSLLSRCPRLLTFSVVWGNACVGDCELQWDEIGEALRLHAPLLEFIDLYPLDAFNYEYGEMRGTIGSLEQLTKLRELKIPLAIIVGSSEVDEDGQDSPASDDGNTPLLPDSLETLHIYSRDTDVSDELCSLIKGSRLPNLRLIRISQPGMVSNSVLESVFDGWLATKEAGEMVITKRKRRLQ